MKKFLCLVLALSFHFPQVQADEWKRVYLATYPRSGNHWTRFVIEEATHIATSSVYPDWTPEYQHLKMPFPWGGYCCAHGYQGNCRYPEKNDIIVIKTHYPAHGKTPFDCASHIKTIRIVRHPVDSFYSDYVFSHCGNPPDKIIPSDLVKANIEDFRRFQNYYNYKPDVATFRYEDLLDDPFAVFSHIFDAIGCCVQKEDIERAVSKYPAEGRLLKHADKYKPEDLELINRELDDFLLQFGYPLAKS